MLKERTTSEKARVDARQRHLNMREELLKRQCAAIDELDAMLQEMLANAKELYASADARANTTIKQKEDLCDRTTSEMGGLSPKIISGDSQRSKNAQTHT
jgi:hypothetical protein